MTFQHNCAKIAHTLEPIADGLLEFEEKFWEPVWKSMVASFQILGTMSLQMIVLMMSRNCALTIALNALHKAGGVLTGHFLRNALIPLSSSPIVKN